MEKTHVDLGTGRMVIFKSQFGVVCPKLGVRAREWRAFGEIPEVAKL